MLVMLDNWKAGVVLAGAAFDAVIIGAAAASVQMASDFQASVTNIITGANDTVDTFQTISSNIMNVAAITGVAKDQIVDAYYQIASHGFTGAKGSDALLQSAKLAQIGLGSEADAGKAVSIVMHDYASANITAGQAAAFLRMMVANGAVTLDQADKSLGTVLETSSALNIPLADVGAAFSTMTRSGISAQRTTQDLTAMFLSFVKPTKQMNDGLAQVGLTTSQVMAGMRTNVPATLEMITKAVKSHNLSLDDQNKILREIFPNQRAYAAYLALSGTNAKGFTATQRELTKEIKTQTEFNNAWAKTQNTLKVQTDRLRESLGNVALVVGSYLLPYVKQFVEWLVPLITHFAQWLKQADNLRNVLIIVGVVVAAVAGIVIFFAGALVVAAAAAAGVSAAAVGLAALIGVIIAAIIALGIVVVMNWVKITSWVGMEFSRLGGFMHNTATNIKNWVGGAFDDTGTRIRNNMTRAKNDVGGAFSDMGTAAHNAVGRIGDAFSNLGGIIHDKLTGLIGSAYSWGANLIGSFADGIRSAISNVTSAAAGAAQAAASHLAIRSPAEKGPMSDADKWAPNLMRMMTMGIIAGTPAFQSALANVGAGGIGSPNSIGGAVGGGYGGRIVKVVIEMDKREIASMVGSAMADEIRVQLGVR